MIEPIDIHVRRELSSARVATLTHAARRGSRPGDTLVPPRAPSSTAQAAARPAPVPSVLRPRHRAERAAEPAHP